MLDKSLRSPGARVELNQVNIDLLTSLTQSLGFSIDRTQTATTVSTLASCLSGTADLHECLRVSGQAGQKVLVLSMTELNREVEHLIRQSLPGLSTDFSVNLKYEDVNNQYARLRLLDPYGMFNVPETQLLHALGLFAQLFQHIFTTTTATSPQMAPTSDRTSNKPATPTVAFTVETTPEAN